MFINTNNKTTSSYNLTNMNKYVNKNIKNKNNNYFTSEKDIGKSYENELEADITVKIINMLISIKSYKSGKYNIGVITPYIGQKKLILEKLCRSNNYYKEDFDYFNNDIISKASIDSFQGKEKDFIIINTVRSNINNNIGFVKDPRRLNVSLTKQNMD
jgi:regulator of nonsense transcripts 1